MAYPITLTDGSTKGTIADGTVNTSTTSLTLIGKNYAGYGNFLNENYIQLLENFNYNTPPNAPLTGQLWFDNSVLVLKVYNGTQWKPISSSANSATAPTNPTIGDLWWDSLSSQLKVWSGIAWITIGPTYTTASGTSGPLVESITDSTGNSHISTKFYISNTIIAILSKDAEYTPGASIAGFTTIKPGFNLISASALTGSQFTGDVSNSLTLQGVSASQFLRSDTASTTNYAFSAAAGLTVGSDLVFDSGNIGVAVIKETTSDKNIRFDLNKSGTNSTALTITASSLATTFGGNILSAGNNLYNIGSNSNKFANIHATYLVGTSITAQYADLAERFAADAAYPAGTVVALGGAKEITAAVEDLTEDVFGVISTNAGFLMNGNAGPNDTHPAIAVNGRVPVRVTGRVRKGDRLVSAGAGLARAANRTEITAFNVIGRSLEDKPSAGEGIIEAIVKLNS
jgi:hypothetical protein